MYLAIQTVFFLGESGRKEREEGFLFFFLSKIHHKNKNEKKEEENNFFIFSLFFFFLTGMLGKLSRGKTYTRGPRLYILYTTQSWLIYSWASHSSDV